MPFSTGLARDPHSAFCTTAVSRAAGRWEPQPGGGGATPLRTRSPSPAAPRVAQQPVGSDVLRPGTRGGAGGLGLRALVWRPVSLRPARGLSPAAQAAGSSAPHPGLFQLWIHRQPVGAAVASASSARPGRAGCEGTGPWPPTLTLRAWCMGVVTAAVEMAPHRLMPAPLRPCPEKLREQGSCQGEHLALTPGVWQRVVACGGVWQPESYGPVDPDTGNADTEAEKRLLLPPQLPRSEAIRLQPPPSNILMALAQEPGPEPHCAPPAPRASLSGDME